MIDEPSRPIEEQLIRSARLRRSQAGDPFELHPTTRNLLQAEVSRTYPPPEFNPVPRRPWFASFWTRFALATSAAAVLIFAVVKIVEKPEAPQLQLARLDEAATAPERPSAPAPSPRSLPLAVSPGPTTAESDSVPGDLAAARHDTFGVSKSLHSEVPVLPAEVHRQSPPTSTPAREGSGRPAPTPIPREGSGGPVSTPNPSDHIASTTLASRAEALQPSSMTSAQPIDTAPLQSLHFAHIQRERLNLQSPPFPDVLRTFQFLQYNDTVQIVDSDGSVYEGDWQPAAPPNPTRFVATGTNRTTQQRVVFAGALHQTLDALPDVIPDATPAPRLGVRTTTLRDSEPVERFGTALGAQPVTSAPIQVIGQATLNNHTRFEIRAVRTDAP
jgi:hypothetical protein